MGAPPAAWHFATLPGKAPTQFEIVELHDARVLKVESNESYGNLIHVLRITPTDRASLAWRWRLDQILAEADIRTRTGDDSAAKICLFFDFDEGRLSLGESHVLALAGCTLEDVVKITVWLEDARDFDEFNRVYGEIFHDHKPSRSTLQAKNVVGSKIEIEAIAYKP